VARWVLLLLLLLLVLLVLLLVLLVLLLLLLLLMEMTRMRRRRIVTPHSRPRHKLPIRINIHHPPTHLILHPLHPIHTTRTHPNSHIQPESHPRAHHHLLRLLSTIVGGVVGLGGVHLRRLSLLLLLRRVLHVPLLLHGVIISLLMLLERHPILLLLHMRLHLMR
jgi:hypothetical protein